MRALTWQGRRHVEVRTVPDPVLQEPGDAVVRVTSSAVCGSDLHLYSVLGPYLDAGDILGHEAMGVVEAVGPAVGRVQVGDRVVVPFGIACGACFMCAAGLQSQCEVTQVRSQGTGAALFGYTRLYGSVPGAQAQYLRVPHAGYGLVPVPDDGEPDERYLFLSDVLPTAWQAVRYGQVRAGDAVVVVGLGPVGQMAARAALHLGAFPVIGIDTVVDRLAMAARHGVEAVDARQAGDVLPAVAALTEGRGADVVIEAVGMEAHGSPVAAVTQRLAVLLPDPVAQAAIEAAGVDRLSGLRLALSCVRRGGTVSVVGVYGGAADPLDLRDVVDRQLTLRFGQANVRRWTGELMALVADPADPLGVLDLRTHRMSLEEAPAAYELFRRREDGCIKVVLDPWAPPTATALPGHAPEPHPGGLDGR